MYEKYFQNISHDAELRYFHISASYPVHTGLFKVLVRKFQRQHDLFLYR